MDDLCIMLDQLLFWVGLFVGGKGVKAISIGIEGEGEVVRVRKE